MNEQAYFLPIVSFDYFTSTCHRPQSLYSTYLTTIILHHLLYTILISYLLDRDSFLFHSNPAITIPHYLPTYLTLVLFIMNIAYISIISIIAKYNNPRTSDQSFRSISTFLQQLSDHSVNIFIRKISFPRTSSISPRAKNARVTIPNAPYKTRVKKRVE